MQRYGAKYFSCRPLYPHHLTKGKESIYQNSTFPGHGHVACQIKGNHECTDMVANNFLADPKTQPQTHGIRSIGQNSTFSEHGHVANQLNGVTKYSNMVAIILPADPPTHTHLHTQDLRVKRSKFNIYRTLSCCISD